MAKAPFSLSPTAMEQQLDTSRRILRMALQGVPKNPEEGAESQETMALHALMTAFVAIAKTSPHSREESLRLLLDAHRSLSEDTDRRNGFGGEPPLKILLT